MTLFTYIDDLMHIQFTDVKNVYECIDVLKRTVSDCILDYNNIIAEAHAFSKINIKNTT